ncbi:hypothetical protein HN020_15490 [Brevibacillus borstelensis]|jgi:hypothetical protein|uniref:hypothetical protein n=1 Tax=Brevibacillus borstelensis TaxID=45462 RepID=UPI00046948EE|nr:hypothetical protein [Brevibacillus borstelensis]MCC0567344.1 hypothetical protein [Brevibacillus borstelensis]MCM3471736.1 hypothetical protein [Brevibacillus borstelensis]MCM3559761.1 hypothetical protein [Brevibacillus borstelensis]MCM3593791.1 hypothetical protein [Brevibacillus borstelensis]MCM3625289.1 hypothetical protein [Brevibacillus borstelensis]
MRSDELQIEWLLEHLKRHQAGKHARNTVKEGLLASRAVIDSLIDLLEEPSRTPYARKIDIS